MTEAERVQPDQENGASHDPISRLLHRLSANTACLTEESSCFVNYDKGVPVSDDSASDKPYARNIGPVTRYRSEKHHRVVRGINIVTLLRSDGDAHIPCDYRIYNKTGDGKTGNDHFPDMLLKAEIRGFGPGCVLSDSRYAGLNNLRTIKGYGFVRIFGIAARNGDTGYRATDDLHTDEFRRIRLSHGQLRNTTAH